MVPNNIIQYGYHGYYYDPVNNTYFCPFLQNFNNQLPIQQNQHKPTLQTQSLSRPSNDIQVKKEEEEEAEQIQELCPKISPAFEQKNSQSQNKILKIDLCYQEQIKTVRNRNILPNIINLTVSYIRRINKSKKILKKILSKYKDERYNLKRFYAYQIYLKSAISGYTSKNILHLIITFCDPSSTIFRIDEQQYYNMICRVLIKYYLSVEGPLRLLTSKKQHKTYKVDHFKIYRYLLNDLKFYIRQQQFNSE